MSQIGWHKVAHCTEPSRLTRLPCSFSLTTYPLNTQTDDIPVYISLFFASQWPQVKETGADKTTKKINIHLGNI
jgi:hypothetical protein